MKVVVSGGTGLIGGALVRGLVADAHRVVVLTRRPEAARLPRGAEAVGWDAESAASLAPVLEGADGVVHLAGESIAAGRWTEEKKRRIRDSRVKSTTALVAALELVDRRPAVLVQGSAVGYYGARGDEPLDERSAPGDDFLASVCQQWESAGQPAEGLGVRRAVARTGVVLSRRGGALPRMALPFKLFAGGPLGSGRQWLPWIHLEDEVAALRFLLERGDARGPFNLTAPEPLTNREFSRELGRALGRPSLLPAPAVAIELALGEMSTLVLDGQRALPKALQAMGFEFSYPTAAEALADLFD